jgi:hypothetical protein
MERRRMARESPAPHRGRHLGPFELGDLPSWLALVGVIAALVFSGYESYQSRQQLRLSEEQSEQKQAQLAESRRALKSSTSAATNQQEREINQLPLTTVELRHLGGELGRARPGNGALASIPAQYAMSAADVTPAELMAPVQARVDAIKQGLAPWAAQQTYLHFAEARCGPASL